ncbi:MAG: aminopeptidase, partial [Desulfobacterales bacterium]|nr:aminopeptidase [Desulfobacterales bacterium]
MGKANEKTKALEERVKLTGKLVWDRYDEAQVKEAFTFAEGYKGFLDEAKTEREAVNAIVQSAQKAGFCACSPKGKDKRIYRINKDKSVGLATMGTRPLEQGMRIIVSHIDSPRLDLKQNPLYEELDMVMLRTHYYGGIKKYQWVAQPLAMHGIIVKTDGKKVGITIGEREGDPVFTICDLLPHLSRKVQEEKKLKEAIEAEKLTILAGHLPFADQEAKERVKLRILELLHQQYGIVEEDFLSAELELVPASKARDVGFDRAFVASYGQDDRVCAYTTLKAMEKVDAPPFATMALFLDKEEVGSEGNTGAKSRFLELFTADILRAAGKEPSDVLMKEILFHAKAISADG